MPLYEYLCPTCDHKFEKLQSMSAIGADCPNCAQPARRAISVFASVTKGGAGEMPTSMGPLPPLSGGGCCGGGCGCGP